MLGSKRWSFAGLLFLACGSNDPAEPARPPDGEKTLPGARVYADDQVLELRFTLSSNDWRYLEERGNEERYVSAEAVVRGRHLEEARYATVGLRHKGAWSLHHCWDDYGGVRHREDECAKLSLKVKFDEYDVNGRLDGLKRLNLHASAGDGTKLRELLAYATFNEFGVDAPRAVPAKVYVNGELLGLFIAVEDIDGRYTRAHYPDGPNGNLYKEIWPNAAAEDAAFIAALETNEEVADVSDLRGFAEAVANTSNATFAEDMAKWVDLDAILRYLAVDRAMRNWDGIMAFYSPLKPHNHYWYRDDGPEGRFHLIPWDLDNTFWEFDPYMYPEQWVTAAPVPDWNAEPANCSLRDVWTPGSGVTLTPPRCDKFLDLLAETHWPRFAELASELRERTFTTTGLMQKVRHWRALIEPIVREDPTLATSAWEAEVEGLPRLLDDVVSDFDAFVASGLIEEPAPETVPELPLEVLNAPTENAGFHVDAVTNFEFASPPSELAFVSTDGEYTTSSVTWNTLAPISGNADLLFDFSFHREPGAYNEWVDLGIGASETDVTGYDEIVLSLASDRPRIVRVRVASAAYAEDLNGIWTEFGDEVGVGVTPQTIAIPLSSLYYPPWAKDAWSETQGWPPEGENDARRTTLRRFTGILFSPFSNVAEDGELLAETETGYLKIDNIYLR